MRQAEVQLRFLRQFDTLYPQFAFRGLRRFSPGTFDPFGFVLRVAFGKAGVELDLYCLALTEGHPQELTRFLQRMSEHLGELPGPHSLAVLIAPYLSQEARELCAAAGVGCFDLAGNARLELNGVYVDIGGRSNPHIRERHVRSPFLGKSERIVRTLLLHPERRWAMRELAAAAGVSLGLASMVTTDLAQMGVVSKGRSGLTLFSGGELLSAWAQEYDLRRSNYRLFRSRYQAAYIERILSELDAVLQERYALTLWSAAHHLLDDTEIRQHVALYWAGNPDDLMGILGLGSLGTANVFIFQPYDESLLWRAQELGGIKLVHPIQLYLDLGSGDEEELALAERVRKRFLPW